MPKIAPFPSESKTFIRKMQQMLQTRELLVRLLGDNGAGLNPESKVTDPVEILDKLHEAQEVGYHVYMAVNDFGAATRNREENLKAIRAVWVEDDGDASPALERVLSFYEPTMIVETSTGHRHIYWALKEHAEGTPENVTKFNHIMRRMVELGCDRKARDICRILRLPGTFNVKEKLERPHYCRVIHEGPHYTWQTLTEIFQPTEAEPDQVSTPAGDWDGDEIREMLRAINLDSRYFPDEDMDYEAYCWSGMAIHHASQGSQEGYELWTEWLESQGAWNDPGSEMERRKQWDSFDSSKPGGRTIATLYREARQCGWVRDTEAAQVTNGNIKQFSFAEALNVPEIEYVVPNLIPRREFGLITGTGGSSKSWVTIDLAYALASGQSWLGHPDFKAAEPQRVLIVTGEDHGDQILRRLKARYELDQLAIEDQIELLDLCANLENHIYTLDLSEGGRQLLNRAQAHQQLQAVRGAGGKEPAGSGDSRSRRGFRWRGRE